MDRPRRVARRTPPQHRRPQEVAGGAPLLTLLAAPLPVPRSELAAAYANGAIVVAGGFTEDGRSSTRVDVYDVRRNRWHRGPDLPLALDHPSAATLFGKVVLVGGYADQRPTTTALALVAGRWQALRPLPALRAAAGAAVLDDVLYVVGGVGPDGLAREVFVYDVRHDRWLAAPGPTPRQHLAVAAAGGRLYAIGGRSAGYDTNTALVESWRFREARWRREPALPEPRGGTAAATVGKTIVCVGGESPAGTSAAVYARPVSQRRWFRWADLRVARHGLGVVAAGDRVYAVGGGPRPGLSVSDANEVVAP